MPLNVNTKAPDFELSTIGAEGPEKIKLSDQYQKKPVVLLFVPMAFTGVCTEEFCSVTENIDQYNQLNATILGISGDNPFAQQAWAEKNGIKLTLLSDYEHTVTKAYGIAYDSFLPDMNLPMGGVPKRSAFVIDTTGTIRYAECNDDPGKLPNFDAIQEVLKGL